MDPHRYRLTEEKIGARLRLIAPMVHRRSVPIEPFRILPLDAPILDAPICADPSDWAVIDPESYWGRADLNFILKSGFTIPSGLDTGALALHLPLGVLGDIFNHPEGMAFVDTVPLGSADRYHHTLPLPAHLADGRRHVLSLHGWTGHAGWPPDPNSKAKLYMGNCCLVELDQPTVDFVNLARAALDTVSILDADTPRTGILSALDAAFRTLDTRAPMGAEFYASVALAERALREGLAQAGDPLDTTLHAVGHAHMDIAYLWPIDQIRLKNQRTYSNVLRLMEDNPDFRFSHSQPALYEMTAKDHPTLFEQIRARVAEGRWEVMGGMWVEPDLNIPGPEALIRQLTLGRDYFRETFGEVETPVLWVPDTFGFSGQIPQLARLAGLDWFVTNKLNWNQYNRVPWATHIWEGIDGSQVKAHVLTTPRDVQYLPFPTNYKSDLTAKEVLGTVTHAGARAASALPICFGYGDGGGGPTKELLAKARAFEAMPGMPRLKLSTVREALAALEQNPEPWPKWTGEHYLEGHRGVYTSQGWIKRANRKAERALHEAEAIAAMAGTRPDLTDAWKLLCLNQFHDVVTGTSVPEVYEDARRDYRRIQARAEDAVAEATAALAASQAQLVSVLPTRGARTVVEQSDLGRPGQAVEDGTLYFFGDVAPYSVTPASATSLPETPVSIKEHGTCIVLLNAFLRVTFDAGTLVSIQELSSGREVLKPGCVGNDLLAFEDRPICWDAWDIDAHYEDRQETLGRPVSVHVTEHGPIRGRIRLTYEWRNSLIRQDVMLTADSRRLDFRTRVDWHETHTLLKVAFPVSVSASEALFDIQWGTIARPTERTSDFGAARFEVPAQKWASLSDERLDIALMNDCKYGYDVREDVLRLTLIKSATSPDPRADQGHHEFTYGLFAAPSNSIGPRNHAAYDLNAPARIIAPDATSTCQGSEFNMSVNADNVVIETLTPNKSRTGFTIRLFECAGRDTFCDLRVPSETYNARSVDIFENELAKLDTDDGVISIHLSAYQIRTIMFCV
ncbi:MAG: glycoside hydrolase family 38 C-terminal domain-containing protein [Pseudomonadota bacterium]